MTRERRLLCVAYAGVAVVALAGTCVAISFTFPLFLIARERRLAARDDGDAALGMTGADVAGLMGLAAIVMFMTIRSVVR